MQVTSKCTELVASLKPSYTIRCDECLLRERESPPNRIPCLRERKGYPLPFCGALDLKSWPILGTLLDPKHTIPRPTLPITHSPAFLCPSLLRLRPPHPALPHPTAPFPCLTRLAKSCKITKSNAKAETVVKCKYMESSKSSNSTVQPAK